jgi:hypothetical protein
MSDAQSGAPPSGISTTLAIEIADNWDQMAATLVDASADKRETLRMCADLIRTLADVPLPKVVPFRYALSARDFHDLVHGQVVTLTGRPPLQIILSDIGFTVMQSSLIQAVLEADLKRAGA